MSGPKRYTAEFSVTYRVTFEDDGDLVLPDQAFEALREQYPVEDAEGIELVDGSINET